MLKNFLDLIENWLSNWKTELNANLLVSNVSDTLEHTVQVWLPDWPALSEKMHDCV